MGEADARYEEALAVITRAWTSDTPFTHHGKYWQFDEVIVEPPTAQKPHPPFWVGAGSRGSISKVAERGYNLLLDQFAPFAATGERLAWFKQEVEARGRVFDPLEVGVARAFYVAKDAADKQAALERRLAAQQRQHALAQTPGGDNKASIMSFADTTGANEDSALYGTPDEICRKIEALEKLGVRYLLLTGGCAARDNLRRFAREVMPAFAGRSEVEALSAAS
jgi:alkanesulfonate monooxygenase SsuD/methylene tetrahydromethanopterin reductase-like flavin-dependent oxidoreductase (luciferase family)